MTCRVAKSVRVEDNAVRRMETWNQRVKQQHKGLMRLVWESRPVNSMEKQGQEFAFRLDRRQLSLEDLE